MDIIISVLLRSRIHIPTYAGLFRVNVSLTLCTAIRFSLNILLLTKVGFEVTSLMSTRLRKFSIVFPKTLLFISLKKSFLNEFLACFRFSVFEVDVLLKPKGIGQILALNGLSLFSNRDLNTAGGYDSATHTLSCLLMLGQVCLLSQLK